MTQQYRYHEQNKVTKTALKSLHLLYKTTSAKTAADLKVHNKNSSIQQ